MSDQGTPVTANHVDDDLKTVKRRNQNRIAQMLHRKRKDQKIDELQKRIEAMQLEDREKSTRQSIMIDKIAELQRENTEMKELVLKLRDVAMLAVQSRSTGQAPSQTPLPTLDWMSGLIDVNNQDPTSSSSLGDVSQYMADQPKNPVNAAVMIGPNLSATSWSNENFTPTLSSSSHATLTPRAEDLSADPQHNNELLSEAVARSFTLAQAAEIIKGTFGDTIWEEDLVPLPEQLGVAEMDAFSAIPACWTDQELPSTTEVDVRSTFDVVRLLETHQFDFDNDLGCPIFQAMVMISIGQGHVTVPVRAEDGNVISSDQLWARLVGRFRSPDEIDLRGLCRTLQSVIDSRPDASMDTSDLDTTINSLLLQPRVAITV